MKKNRIYHLSQCSTCKKIIGSLNISSCELQDIKVNAIQPGELDGLAKLAGSYEALFSRKAIKYRSLNLHLKILSEADYRELILSEYTFLKRPVIRVGNQLFIGNTKNAVDGAIKALKKK
jgi:arsenate reductase